MGKVFLFIIWLWLIPVLTSAETRYEYLTRLSNAIYHAEGGVKARKPFGLISYKLSSKKDYQVACITKLNAYLNEWEYFKSPGDFVVYLGNYWAPTVNVSSATRKLNNNWVKNVKWYLANPKPI